MNLDLLEIELNAASQDSGISCLDIGGEWQSLKNSEIEDLGVESLEYAGKFRTLGVVDLLTIDSSRYFRKQLTESGKTRTTYLLRCAAENALDDFHRASGFYEPLLDAIVADDFAVARKIAELSPLEHRPNAEHQEDYYYAQILHHLVQETPPEEDLKTLLLKYETSLEDRPKTRLNICKALTNIDQDLFDAAFSELLDEWGKSVGTYLPWDYKQFTTRLNAARAEAAKTGEEDFKTSYELLEMLRKSANQICIEALALLKLAQHQGLTTKNEYPYCPERARLHESKQEEDIRLEELKRKFNETGGRET